MSLGFLYVEGPYPMVGSGALRQGRAAKLGTTVNTVTECDTAGEVAYGIAIEDAADTKAAGILRQGRYDRAVAGAALATLHTELAVDTQGRYVAATVGQTIVGINLTTAAAAGDEFVIQLDTAQRTA